MKRVWTRTFYDTGDVGVSLPGFRSIRPDLDAFESTQYQSWEGGRYLVPQTVVDAAYNVRTYEVNMSVSARGLALTLSGAEMRRGGTYRALDGAAVSEYSHTAVERADLFAKVTGILPVFPQVSFLGSITDDENPAKRINVDFAIGDGVYFDGEKWSIPFRFWARFRDNTEEEGSVEGIFQADAEGETDEGVEFLGTPLKTSATGEAIAVSLAISAAATWDEEDN